MLRLLITISEVGYFSSVDLEVKNKLYFKGGLQNFRFIEIKIICVLELQNFLCYFALSLSVIKCRSWLDFQQAREFNSTCIQCILQSNEASFRLKCLFSVFQDNFVQVMHNQEFLILPAEEVCRLLASDDLNVPDEETIFQALVMWAKHDLSNRKKYLAKLLSHIKLPLMSPQVLLGSTYRINLIKLF